MVDLRCTLHPGSQSIATEKQGLVSPSITDSHNALVVVNTGSKPLSAEKDAILTRYTCNRHLTITVYTYRYID